MSLYFGKESIIKAHPEFKTPLETIPKEFSIAYDSAQGHIIVSLTLWAKNIVVDKVFIKSNIDYAKLIPSELIKQLQSQITKLEESVKEQINKVS
jgi:tRNA U34 5-carboxymethylaminomethyl modifying GTPase MnmE/TrmE